MVTTSIPGLALIDIFTCLPIHLESESSGAAAVDACGRVLTGAVAASVVDGTRFHEQPTLHPFISIRH